MILVKISNSVADSFELETYSSHFEVGGAHIYGSTFYQGAII